MKNDGMKRNMQIGLLLSEMCPKVIKKVVYKPNMLNVFVESKDLINILTILQNNTMFQYKMLLDIVVVDCLNIDENKKGRFKLLYVLHSIYNNHRLNIVTYLNNNEIIKTSSLNYSSAVWLEREIWDMYGIYFESHPDLRRILTDYGFSWYPLRKDFPLTGYLEVYYDINDKKIIYKSIELMQEFRNYEFGKSWGDFEQKTYIGQIIQ
uniref:NADH dehydrogenase subunit 9 n=1 Tax=Cavenderia fasciculata TaxID=261658 RepID=B2XX85_CACFS|nr:NADH dehydrogenase subunit 9 [Cavenderia fasciculata]ABX45207.1 NADH dehydrogenase subunit 9 [Cavenderia fasciculata]